MDFQHILNNYMIEHSISRAELAHACSTTEATIGRTLNGVTTPNSAFVLRLAEALGVSIDYLMGRTPCEYMIDDKRAQDIIIGKLFSRCTERDQKIITTILEGYCSGFELVQLRKFRGEG